MCERCREYNAAAVDYRNQAMDAERRLVDLDRIITNIRIHFEQLCSDDLRQHGYIAPDHDIDFQVFRALCGYKEALVERVELQEAVRWYLEYDEFFDWMWDQIGDNDDEWACEEEMFSGHWAARAAVDALVGEG